MLSIVDGEHWGTTESHCMAPKARRRLINCWVWPSCTLALFSLLLAFPGICFAMLTATFSLYLLETSGMKDRFSIGSTSERTRRVNTRHNKCSDIVLLTIRSFAHLKKQEV